MHPKSTEFTSDDILDALHDAAEQEPHLLLDGGVGPEHVRRHLDGPDLAEKTISDYLRRLADRGDVARLDAVDPETYAIRAGYLPADQITEDRYVERP